jgi:RNA recognition motif-containing protein
MGKRLYVGNLSWDTTEDNLRAAFSQGGRTVSDCHIVSDRDTGRPRGFAFVEMSSDAEAQAAIQDMDGTNLDGRDIRVNEAQERQSRGGGGGGPRGGGGGRGGRSSGGGGGDRW